jgi:hypothetical protein
MAAVHPLATGLRARAALVFGVLLASMAMTFALGQQATAVAKPSSNSRECQHPLTTGQEAVNIRGVSPQEACKTVRALARFIENGAKPARLYECAGISRNHPGRPVLKIHRFDGWNLKVVKTYGFRMSRDGGAFEVTGTDFPLNCT